VEECFSDRHFHSRRKRDVSEPQKWGFCQENAGKCQKCKNNKGWFHTTFCTVVAFAIDKKRNN